MEEIKDKQQIKLRIKVNPYSSYEKVREQLDDKLLYSKIKFTIKKCIDGNEYLNIIMNGISEYKSIASLEIKLADFIDLSFESFYKFQNFSSLTHLNLILTNKIILMSHQRYTLGECLKELKNLESLELNVNCSRFTNQYQFLNMSDAFNHCSNLIRYELYIESAKDRSLLFQYLIEGIRNLTYLKSFKINMQSCRVRDSKFLEIFDDEAKYLSNLTEFNFQSGWGNFITSSNLKVMANILMKLPQLEIFNVQTSFQSSNLFNQNITEFENAISSLVNLKAISFKVVGSNNISMQKLLLSISKLPKLEDTQLDFYLSQPSQYDDNTQQFAYNLASIKSLTSLKIYFSFTSKLSIQDIQEFIGTFKELKTLKQLNINISNQDKQGLNGGENNNDFIETLSKLKIFTFSIYESTDESENCCANRILDAVSGARELKDLLLSFRTFSKNENGENLVCTKNILENQNKIEYLKLDFSQKYEFSSLEFSSLFSNMIKNPITDLQLNFEGGGSYDLFFIQQLSKCIAELKQLTCLELWLGEEKIIGNQGLQYLTEAFGKKTNFSILDLSISKTQVNHNTLIDFISCFQKQGQLTQLDLTIGGKNFESFSEVQEFAKQFLFPERLNLVSLQLPLKNIKYKNLRDLFVNISKLKKLSFLKIELNEFAITQEDVIELKILLSQLKLLNDLRFRFYSFTMLYLINLFDDLPFLNVVDVFNHYVDSNLMKVILKKKEDFSIAKLHYNEETCVQNQEVLEKYSIKLQNDILFQQNDLSSYLWCFQHIIRITQFKLKIYNQSKIEAQQFFNFFKGMSNLINLTILKIYIGEENNVNTESLLILGLSIQNMANLQILHFDYTSKKDLVDWDQGSSFTEGFRNLSLLQEFKFKMRDYGLRFHQKRTQILIQELIEMKNLKKLTINIVERQFFAENNQLDNMSNLLSMLKCKLSYLKIIYISNSKSQQKIQFHQQLKQLEDLTMLRVISDKSQNHKLYKMKRLVSIIFKDEYNYY